VGQYNTHELGKQNGAVTLSMAELAVCGQARGGTSLCGELVQWMQCYLRAHPIPRQRRRRQRAEIDRQVLSDILHCCLTPPHQVAWREGGTGRHREFKVREEAASFFESLGAVRKRLTCHGREEAVAGVDGRGWPAEWVPDHPSAYRRLDDFLCAEDMARLGGLGRRTRVKLDASMSETAHGRAERCVHTGIPVCRVNPATPDVRYVILHELMHHQLNEIGCPALVCPQLGRRQEALTLGSAVVPDGSWLHSIDVDMDPNFVPNLVTTLWELIQHSRFNGFLMNTFGCGSQGARDRDLQGLFSGETTFPYCSRADAAPVRVVMMAMHYVTAALESSPRATLEFERYLRAQGDEGRCMLSLGARVLEQIHAVDTPVCSLSPDRAEAMIAGMWLCVSGCLCWRLLIECVRVTGALVVL